MDCDFFLRSEKKLQQTCSALHNPPGTQAVVHLSWRMLEGLKDNVHMYKKKEKGKERNGVTLIKESNGCLCACLNLHSHIKGLITF